MIGTCLGPYEITAKLGEGGMGEVWRAHDAQLGRDVALKVLPEEFTKDAERLARFEREAKLLAQLNHQNIAHIYGLETSGATRALVMELVEGPTLADRLKSGALPLEESLSIAHQIAEALEEAHEKGIIHRDLKPQNVKASIDGKVKVLDFGLAKAMEPVTVDPASASQLAQSPTLTLGATIQGVILGTAAYMAPEQAKGLTVDKRADIWAFGVVLWEMLTGKSLFASDSVADTLARVLQREVDFEALPESTPTSIRRLLRRILERQPKNRLHDIADARLVIDDALTGRDDGRGGALELAPAPGRRRWVWALGGLLIGAALAAAIVTMAQGSSPSTRPPFRGQFDINLPPGRHLDAFYRRALAISPDGKTIAVITSGAAIPPADRFDPDRRIELRAIDGDLFRPVAGTEGAVEMAFSPDGRWLAFTVLKPEVRNPFADLKRPYSELRKVPIAGGEPVKLADTHGGWGLTWGEDGAIALTNVTGGIDRIAPEGGAPRPIPQLKPSTAATNLASPLLVDGGSALLFTECCAGGAGSAAERIYAQRIGATDRKMLAAGATDPRFARPDHLLFARNGTLWTEAFVPGTLQVTGEPVPLVPSVAHSVGVLDLLGWTEQAQYDVSGDGGVLVLAPGTVAPEEQAEIVRIDARGHATVLDLPPASYLSVRVSPDGNRLLLARSYLGRQLEVLDLVRGGRRQVTFNANPTERAIWGPGANEVTFSSDHDGSGPRIYSQAIDQTSESLRALTKPGLSLASPMAWSPGGRILAFGTYSVDENSLQVWLLEGDSVRPYLAADYYQGEADISPDGRWLADVDAESSENEVWVRSFPEGDRKYQVSINGGRTPVWSRDGRWIYFVAGDPFKAPGGPERAYFKVRFDAVGDEARLGRPERLFAGDFFVGSPSRCWDVAPNGDFYLIRKVELDPQEKLRRAELLFPTKLRVLVGMLDAPTGKAQN